MRVQPQLLGMLSRDHLIWKLAHAEQNSMSSTGSFQTGPAKWWSKKCNCLRSQVKKRPPNFNQYDYL